MDSIVVLTTQERADWFRAALGKDVDFRFDYRKSGCLKDLLTNIKIAGGSIAVLDEDYFPSAEEMLSDVEAYINDINRKEKAVRIVVVCSRRNAKDRILSRLAGYCHIYDLLYGVDGVDIVGPLRTMVENPRSRLDVVSLLEGPSASVSTQPGHDEVFKDEVQQRSGKAVSGPLEMTEATRILKPGQRIVLEVIVR